MWKCFTELLTLSKSASQELAERLITTQHQVLSKVAAVGARQKANRDHYYAGFLTEDKLRDFDIKHLSAVYLAPYATLLLCRANMAKFTVVAEYRNLFASLLLAVLKKLLHPEVTRLESAQKTRFSTSALKNFIATWEQLEKQFIDMTLIEILDVIIQKLEENLLHDIEHTKEIQLLIATMNECKDNEYLLLNIQDEYEIQLRKLAPDYQEIFTPAQVTEQLITSNLAC